MSEIAVVYQSKYGSTKQYAQWIADALNCDLLDRTKIKAEQLAQYQTLIYGGGLYGGGVSGLNLITQSFELFKDKNLVLFTCGIADTKDQDNIQGIKDNLNKVLTEEMQNKIKIFHLRGGMDYHKLTFIHKIMMKMLYKMLSKKDANTIRNEDKVMLESYGKAIDFTDKNAIQEILTYVQKL